MKIRVSVLNGQYFVWDAHGESSSNNLILDAVALRQDRIVGRFVGTLPQMAHQNTFLSLPLLIMYEQVKLLEDLCKIQLVDAVASHSTPTATQATHYHNQKQTELLEYSQLYKDYALAMKEFKQGKTSTEPIPPLAPIFFPTPSTLLPWYQPSLTTLPPCVTRLDHVKYLVFKHYYSLGYYVTAASKFGGDFLVYKQDPFLCHSSYIITVVESIDTPIPNLDMMTWSRLATMVKKQRRICSWDEQQDTMVSFGLEWNK